MEFDDFLQSETAIAVAATATVLSPRVRRLLRQGAVYAVAGALIGGEAAASFARGVGRGTQQAPSSVGSAAQEATSKVGNVLQSAAGRTRAATGLDGGSGS
jgi:uncharacterized protein (DUF1786 family)